MDIERVRGPLDILDHAAPFLGAGEKVGLDATRKVNEAETHRVMDELATTLCAEGEIVPVIGAAARDAEARIKAIAGVLDARIPDELGGWWLVVRAGKSAAGDGAAVIKALGALANDVPVPRWTVVVGPDADLADTNGALFHWTAQTAFERDGYLSKCGRRIAFDATPKLPGDERNGQPVRAWPPILRMDDAVVERIKQRWDEFSGASGSR